MSSGYTPPGQGLIPIRPPHLAPSGPHVIQIACTRPLLPRLIFCVSKRGAFPLPLPSACARGARPPPLILLIVLEARALSFAPLEFPMAVARGKQVRFPCSNRIRQGQIMIYNPSSVRNPPYLNSARRSCFSRSGGRSITFRA